MEEFNVYITPQRTWATCSITGTDLDELRGICTYRWLNHKRVKCKKSLCVETTRGLIVPRFAPFVMDRPFGIYNSISTGPEIQLNQVGQLNDNQELICDYIMENYLGMPEEGNAGVTIIMPTGAGKTYVGLGLLFRLKRRALVVCPGLDLLDQWRKTTAEFFDGDISEKIEFITIQKLSRGADPEFFAQFDCIVFDEAHSYASEKRAAILAKCQRTYMIGLTATPYKKDNSHLVIELNIGPLFNALEVPGYQQNPIPFTADVQMVKYLGPYTDNVYNDNGDIDYSNTLNQILDDPERVRLVAAMILSIEAHHNVFVFADRREYLLELKKKMEDIRGSQDAGEYCVLGGSKNSKEALDRARIIFSTYQLYGTGTSIPRMSAVVFASPRKDSLVQPLGRIFRGSANADVRRHIVDVVDWNVPVFKRQWSARQKIYLSRAFDITVI